METSQSIPPVAPQTPDSPPPAHAAQKKRTRLWLLGLVALVVIIILVAVWIVHALSVVSTDDAYVNGHVTFVAARVPGQVVRVLVDDNNRVRKGDLLVQIDPEPWQVQVNIAQAAVNAAQADLVAAQANIRALEGKTRSLRFALQHAIEDVDNQVALLRAKVASLNSAQATQTKAQADYTRVLPLVESGAVTREEVDRRKESLSVAQAGVEAALQGVYQVRVSLGLPPKPESGDDLAQVPADLDQTFSAVRQAQASLIESAAQLGVLTSFEYTPKQMVDEFYKRDPHGDINRIYDELAKSAPGVKQAQQKLAQVERNLDQAKLNLSYCNVVSEIDGVVTRRDINPGNNIVAGQSLMAVRSLTDIWVDANFKETQLGELRIGQRVDLDVDMYGSRKKFEGRISGFTMGTGSTLALLPAENATGNFVKVVQRLPVRIDLLNYDPDKQPLFVGLSVEPKVYIKEDPTGPDAGHILQPVMTQPKSELNPGSIPLSAMTAPATPTEATTQPEKRP